MEGIPFANDDEPTGGDISRVNKVKCIVEMREIEIEVILPKKHETEGVCSSRVCELTTSILDVYMSVIGEVTVEIVVYLQLGGNGLWGGTIQRLRRVECDQVKQTNSSCTGKRSMPTNDTHGNSWLISRSLTGGGQTSRTSTEIDGNVDTISRCRTCGKLSDEQRERQDEEETNPRSKQALSGSSVVGRRI